MSRLNHISTYSREISIGDAVKINGTRNIRRAGRYLYRVEKNGAPMRFVFALGSYVFDVRDLAHLYAENMLVHLHNYTCDIDTLVLRAVLDAAEPHLHFPRQPKLNQQVA